MKKDKVKTFQKWIGMGDGHIGGAEHPPLWTRNLMDRPAPRPPSSPKSQGEIYIRISLMKRYSGRYFYPYFGEFPRGLQAPPWYAVGAIFAARQFACGISGGTAPASQPAR